VAQILSSVAQLCMGYSTQHANRRRLWASSDWQDDSRIQKWEAPVLIFF